VLDLLEQQDRLTANQWKIALAATIGDMLDFFDFLLIAFVLAFIVRACLANIVDIARLGRA
jgi:MFS transporter, putative metabolite:H+ symporter